MSIIRSLKEARERNKANENDDIDLVVESSNSALVEGIGATSNNVPTHNETSLGLLDYEAVVKSSAQIEKKRRGTYQLFSPTDRYKIGKYASEYGTSSTLRNFKNTFPNLKESTVRSIRQKYEEELRQSLKEKRDPTKSLTPAQRGRPLMLGKIDLMVQDYLRAVRRRGGVVNKSVAISVVKALIKRHPESQLDHIDLDNATWARSLFHRMKFVRRMGTTGKVKIPDSLREEVEISYLHAIVRTIEENNIPTSLVMNLDQTPTKFIPGTNKTMALKGSKTVPISGLTDKRMITATFTITLDGLFLPPQLIYGGKTTKSLPRVKFPSSFSLSVNEKHYSNETESIKVLEEIVIPYVIKERRSLLLPSSQPALLIMDVFKGQMTDRVVSTLQHNNIILITVPANLTYLFQPLDVQGGPNGYVKRYMKKNFCDWYASQITYALDEGKEIDEIEVPLKLSIVKPLHAKWFIEMYNHMTNEEGRKVCLKGWQVAGIQGAVEKGSAGLPNLDPFKEIDPITESLIDIESRAVSITKIHESSKYISNEANSCESDSDGEWVGENEDIDKLDENRNIFDNFDDEQDDE